MGIYLEPLSDRAPDNLVLEDRPKLFINDLKDDVTGQEILRRHLYVDLGGDMDVKPTCTCGATVLYVAAPQDDVVCPKCNTKPRLTMDHHLESTLFFRKPPKIARMMFPSFIDSIITDTNAGSFKPVEYLLNRRYVVPSKIGPKAKSLLEKFEERGIKRGYNFFVNNIELVTETLIPPTTEAGATMQKSIATYGDRLFTNNLAFMCNLLFIMEHSQGDKHYDSTFRELADIVMSLVGIEKRPLERQEDILGRATYNMAHFYRKHFRTMYSGKNGVFRKSIYAGKGITGMRVVATAITGPMKYDHIALPWGPTIQTMTTHLISLLLKKGMSLNLCMKFIQDRLQRYCPHMHALLKELQGEDGLPFMLERYPILGSASMWLGYGTYIKTNPEDRAVGIPAPIVPGSNLDFDGDELSMWLLDDKLMRELMQPLSYHNVIYDRMRAHKVNKNLTLSKPSFSNLSGFLESGANLSVTPEQLNAMYSAFS